MGNPPSNFPDGEMISIEPPPTAVTPRYNKKLINRFLAVIGCM
jgi:hypothetical protein